MGDWILARLADSSESEDTFDSSASVSDINAVDLLTDGGRPRVGQNRVRAPPPFYTVRTSSARSSIVHVSSGVSTRSSGSEVLSYTSSTESTWGSTPEISAPEAENYHLNPVLRDYALNTPPATPAASPPRQISGQSSVSSLDKSDTEETDSYSDESRPEQPTLGTPASSNIGSADENALVVLDHEPAHRIAVIPVQEALISLFLQGKSIPRGMLC